MKKLKKVLEQYPKWESLGIYILRIETYFEVDFSLCFDNIKSLLESIAKEICKQNGKELAKNPKMSGIMKQALSSFGFSNSDMILQLSSSFGNIGQQIGNLRNDITSAGHGRTIEEIKRRNQTVDLYTREFLLNSVENFCVFLVHTFENNKTLSPIPKESFEHVERFNDYLDDQNEDYEINVNDNSYSYTASEILSNVDNKVYVDEYKTFIESEEE